MADYIGYCLHLNVSQDFNDPFPYETHVFSSTLRNIMLCKPNFEILIVAEKFKVSH